MKTIQQVLRELDKDKIIDAYFYRNPINLWELKKQEEDKIEDVKGRVIKRLGEFIERLRTLEIMEKPEHQGILFVHKCLRNYRNSDEEYSLVFADELMAAEDLAKVTTYAYELTEWKETLAFLVADNKLTQDNLMDLVVDFLYESSFFGYKQEDLEKEIRELEEAAKEVHEHPERLISWDDIRKEHGLPEREDYPLEDELKDAFYKASNDYSTYCRVMELEKIKEALCQGV